MRGPGGSAAGRGVFGGSDRRGLCRLLGLVASLECAGTVRAGDRSGYARGADSGGRGP